jgi:hypothetical protein
MVARVRAAADVPGSCPYQPESIRCLVDRVGRRVGVPHGSGPKCVEAGCPATRWSIDGHDNTSARSTARAASWHSVYGKMATFRAGKLTIPRFPGRFGCGVGDGPQRLGSSGVFIPPAAVAGL